MESSSLGSSLLSEFVDESFSFFPGLYNAFIKERKELIFKKNRVLSQYFHWSISSCDSLGSPWS